MKIQLVGLPFGDSRLSEESLSTGLECIDSESRARVLRFRHSEDKWRCLVGRLLPRCLLASRGFQTESIVIKTSQSGKPFIAEPPGYLSFNVTHDSNLVAMGYSTGDVAIGIDVMKCELPRGETMESYLSVLSGSLTLYENGQLEKRMDNPDLALELLYEYWTIKEAYTKALGIGLGFDFTRIEYRHQPDDSDNPIIAVDGAPVRGWQFRGLRLTKDSHRYICVVAICLGTSDESSISWTELDERTEWVENINVFSLLARAHPLTTT